MLLVNTTDLARINGKLADYVKVNKRYTVPEVLEKKGTDVRIKVFQLFRNESFGGRNGKRGSIAWRELRKRGKEGRGTLVRIKDLQARWGSPPAETKGKKQRPHALSDWQKLVWQETTRRQSGIGVLAISFLSKEFRRGFKGPTLSYTAKNESKTMGTLSEVKHDGTSFTISGFTPGLVEVANRNNIANRALSEMEKDLDVYLNRKHEEARKMVFTH